MVHVVEFSPYWYELSLLYFLNGEYIKGAIAFRHGFTTKSYTAKIYIPFHLLCGIIFLADPIPLKIIM